MGKFGRGRWINTPPVLSDWLAPGPESVNSDVAKALHRFLSTHKKFEYPFNLQTLCDAINLNTDQESSEKRISSINFGSIITGNIDPDSTNIDISLNSYFLDQYLGKLSTSNIS